MALSRIDTTNMIEDVPQSKIDNNINFRNIIINGDMSIAQRGTSVSGVNSSGYRSLDRFKQTFSGGDVGTWTQSQSTDVPSSQGFAKSLKLDCTTARTSPSSNEGLFIEQKIEGQNLQYLKKGTSSAESLTLSFWVKSNKTGTYISELRDQDNSRTISKSYTISSADTWEKKTITYAGDTSGTLGNDNGDSLRLIHWLVAGSDFTSGTLQTSWGSLTSANRAVGQVNLADSTSNEWYITGIQLEAGTTASDFEFLPVDVNLQRCQRYFFQIQGNSSGNTGLGVGFCNSATAAQTYLKYPTTMRSTPSITGSSGLQTSDGNSYTKSATGVTVDSGSTVSMHLNVAASSMTVFRGCFNTLTNSTSSYIAFSSEL
jgi:hypothetical protein